MKSRRQGVREGLLVLKTGEEGKTKPRLTFVISKKVDKRSTARNRIRRVLREAAQKELARAGETRDAAFIVLPGFKLPAFEEVRLALRRLLRKAPPNA